MNLIRKHPEGARIFNAIMCLLGEFGVLSIRSVSIGFIKVPPSTFSIESSHHYLHISRNTIEKRKLMQLPFSLIFFLDGNTFFHDTGI